MLRITAVALASLALASVMPICVTGKPSGGDGHPMLPVNPPHSGSIPGPSLWRRACQPGQYSVSGTCRSCGQGYYCSGNGDRNACPAGTYNDQTTSQRENECKAIQCGFRPSGGNADGTGATGQTMCGEGYYSKGRSTTCTICPAGMYCNAQTTCDPKPCDPGTYADTPGAGQRCKDCPAGTFNNSYGNTSCCNCCAGWFSQGNNTHTNCERCPNIGEVQSSSVTGPVGSDSKDKLASSGRLRLARNHEPNPQEVAVCMRVSLEIVVDEAFGFIAATSGNTPSGAMTRSTTSTCPYGTTRCEVKFGRGGFECVDILNSLETCGGCDNDCSSLEGTNEVQCIKGQCVVKSCAGGHELAIRGDGFARGGLEVGAHCVAKKRNHIRHATML
ncbi:Si dkey-21a6.5 [Rhizoctonia solani]|uniref:Si dkey-21a6.5 n=1 Tax=Rhizoctonia solani TaxID=456999 RepID=A0A8H7LH06_9AGAM|nr:Si dkey-21a6.5 [Rhizoctonia solani]